MQFRELLTGRRVELKAFLEDYFAEKAKTLGTRTSESLKAITRLGHFTSRGGMLRGMTAILASEAFGCKNKKDVFAIAAACELFQSALLIHDDIMDRDTLRRGEPTVFAQYMQDAQTTQQHYGESMGINVGDLSLMLAFDLLSSVSKTSASRDLMEIASREIAFCVAGQLQDFASGYVSKELTMEEIMTIYRNKTASYTFALPLQLAAALAGKKDFVEVTAALGEKAGVLFQIKDDELGLFSTEQEIGKPVGSDIRENKKTLFRLKLFELANEQERKKLETLFGSQDITKEDVVWVQALGKTRKIQEAVYALRDPYYNEAKKLLAKLKLKGTHKEIFEAWLEYNIVRRT